MTSRQPDPSTPLGRCTCGAEVQNDGFRDRASYLEFRITGNCQDCQDRMCLCTNAHDPSQPFALRHAAVVAHDVHRDEFGLLPFVSTAEPRLAWDAHRIVRIGARLQPLDPYRALAPMADALTDHAVRLHESATILDPAVPMRLACIELLVALDRGTRRHASRLPLPHGHQVVVLARETHWNAHYGTSLSELERVWGADPARHRSTLRTCALVGWALEHGSELGTRPIDTIRAFR